MSQSLTLPERARVTGGKYLTFVLAGEEYGFEILTVHEIIGMLPITPVPNSHRCVRGVVNLRGKVIPIVDLRRRFGMPEAEEPETCIIVVAVTGLLVGIAVDAVSEVVTIANEQVEPPPSFGTDVDTTLLLGLAKSETKVRLLLDVARVLDPAALAGADAAA